MKTRKPYKNRWFYAFGPQGEMVIDNNQNKVARIYSCSQGVISDCLRGERRQHNGWRFTLIENPCYFKEAEKEIKPEALQQDPTPQEREETDAKHMKAATTAGIRHLMASLYPQWETEKAEGYIFTG